MGASQSIYDGKAIHSTKGKFTKAMPDSVFCEKLSRGANPDRRFAKSTPDAVHAFMAQKEALTIYEQFKRTIVDEAKPDNAKDKWDADRIVDIVDSYNQEFGDKGIKVFFCMRLILGGGAHQMIRWLEYKDLTNNNDAYAPEEKYTRSRSGTPTNSTRKHDGSQEPAESKAEQEEEKEVEEAREDEDNASSGSPTEIPNETSISTPPPAETNPFAAATSEAGVGSTGATVDTKTTSCTGKQTNPFLSLADNSDTQEDSKLAPSSGETTQSTPSPEKKIQPTLTTAEL